MRAGKIRRTNVSPSIEELPNCANLSVEQEFSGIGEIPIRRGDFQIDTIRADGYSSELVGKETPGNWLPFIKDCTGLDLI